MASTGPGHMLKQAEHIWKMLDQLADTDPEAYQKFVKRNVTEGKKGVALPKPFTCIKTEIIMDRGTSSPLYINVCQWSRVPGPKTPSDAVPITGGPLEKRNLATGEGYCMVTRVAINPEVLKDCSLHKPEMNLLIKLICSYLEEQHGHRISKTYTHSPEKYFGDVAELSNFFGQSDRFPGPSPTEDLKTLSPEMLLTRMAEMSVGGDDTDTGIASLNRAPRESEPGKRVLIEEIGNPESHLTEPRYEMAIREEGDGKGRRAVLRVKLPGVNSVSECDLQISETAVTLHAADKYLLDVEIEEAFVEDMVSAKFYKKTSTLSVTLPLQGS